MSNDRTTAGRAHYGESVDRKPTSLAWTIANLTARICPLSDDDFF